MRLLSVASFLPYPPDDATRNRAWNLITRLARVHHLTLLTWVPPGREGYVDEVRKHVQDLIPVPVTRNSYGLVRRSVTRLHSIARQVPPFMIERVARHPVPIVKGEFDLVIAEDDAAAWLVPDVGCPLVIHRHNVFGKTIEGLRDSGYLGWQRRAKWTIELPSWHRLDVDLSSAAALNLVTTPEACRELKTVLPGDPWIEVCPNGTDLTSAPLNVGEDLKVVFVGTMSYEPNADAAVRFSKTVWPLVNRRWPKARLEIIGRGPLQKVSALRIPGVEVRGEVPDVLAACRGARLGVVPLYAGSGIKTKTLELMALGLPVVATPIGAEGISAREGQGLFVSDNDQGLANHIDRLLSDQRLAVQCGREARRFVETNFSWESTMATYNELLNSVFDHGASDNVKHGPFDRKHRGQ